MKIALIGCSASKACPAGDERTLQAKHMYTGRLFQAQYTYARQVLGLRDGEIFVLSAKYKLVMSNTYISSYDRSLGRMKKDERKDWAQWILIDLYQRFGGHEIVTYSLMAGKLYREFLDKWLLFCTTPHPAGLGYAQQVQWYQEQVKLHQGATP